MTEEEFKEAIRVILAIALAVAMIMVLFYGGKEAGCGVMFGK
jgi:hypothetical protein